MRPVCHKRLEKPLANLPHDDERGDEALQFCQTFIDHYTDLEAFVARLQRFTATPGADDRVNLDRELHALLWQWFQSKLVYVDDPHTSGDDIVLLIARTTPPRYVNRIMGMQNIKGTGLGFVYAWQAWEQCWRAGAQLGAEREEIFNEGLRSLVGFQEFGVLSANYLRGVLAAARHHRFAQREATQAQLATIEHNCESAAQRIDAPSKTVHSAGSRLTRAIDWLEQFLDAGDAVRRRRLADAVYRDLVDERISEDRAILEIKQINARQKGGWLRKRLEL